VGIATAGLIVLAAAGFGLFSLFHKTSPVRFQNFTITQVTNSGKAALTAISPDGRYVLTVINNKGLQSLWLRNLPDQQRYPSDPTHPQLPTRICRSRRTEIISISSKLWTPRTLTSICIVRRCWGRSPTMVRGIDSDVSFSPDGLRIAFARENVPEAGKYRLITANLGGGTNGFCRSRRRLQMHPRSSLGLPKITGSPTDYLSQTELWVESPYSISGPANK